MFEHFKKEAELKGLVLILDTKSYFGSFYTDQYELELIIKNLLDNTIKFTTEGRLSFSLSASNMDEVLISISDTG